MAWSSIQDLSRAQTAGFRFHEISGMSRRVSARHAAAQNATQDATRATRKRQHGQRDFDARGLRQPKPKARAMTDRHAGGSTGADSRSPKGRRQPHAEGERYLGAKGKAAAADGRPKAEGVWAGFSGPGEE